MNCVFWEYLAHVSDRQAESPQNIERKQRINEEEYNISYTVLSELTGMKIFKLIE